MKASMRILTEETIHSLTDAEKALLQPLDIYYQPAFLRCDASLQNGHWNLAIVLESENYWVYPYILIPLPGESDFFDMTSPYGYAGPATNDLTFGKIAEQAWLTEIRQNPSIVTEFVRYHPVYNRTYFFVDSISNNHNRTIVGLHTDLTEDQIWNEQFSGTNRNLVRKLEKEEYTWQIKPFESTDVGAFTAAYKANMIHSGATDFYFFPDHFYLQLIEELGDGIQLATVTKDGTVYCQSLFFLCGEIVTYYLSARNLDYPKVTATNFLLSKMAFWCHQNGFKWLNFGGGLSLAEDDRLFKFKSNFARTTLPFHIGKRIHNAEKYEALKTSYTAIHGKEAFEAIKHILQFYR